MSKYLISAANPLKARQIARDKGLNKTQWVYIPLVCKNHPRHELIRGYAVPEHMMLGDWTPQERAYLSRLERIKSVDINTQTKILAALQSTMAEAKKINEGKETKDV